MGSSYFVSADRQNGATWAITPEQLAQATTRAWHESTVTGPSNDTLALHVRVGEHHCELSFQSDHQVFVFRDQDSLSAPLTIIHTLLRELAPGVPAVWWADFDATLEPLDPAADLETFIADFGA